MQKQVRCNLVTYLRGDACRLPSLNWSSSSVALDDGRANCFLAIAKFGSFLQPVKYDWHDDCPASNSTDCLQTKSGSLRRLAWSLCLNSSCFDTMRSWNRTSLLRDVDWRRAHRQHRSWPFPCPDRSLNLTLEMPPRWAEQRADGFR